MPRTKLQQELARLADVIRSPLRLRVLSASVTVGIMYFAIQQPLEVQAIDFQRKTRELERKDRVAQEVAKLQKGLKEIDSRLLSANNGAATAFLLTAVRESAVELQRIDGQTDFTVGPFQASRLRISVGGSSAQLHSLLQQLEEGSKLIRIETVAMVPPTRDEVDPSLQLSLVILAKGANS